MSEYIVDANALIERWNEMSVRGRTEFDQEIMVASSIRPQGVWIIDLLNHESICSVCGANETEFIYGTEMWYGLGESKFCPACGAKMRRNKEND